jgi:MoxR-like ATPase
MSNPQYAGQILSLLQKSPNTLPPIDIDDSRRNNAGRCMTALACHRLAQGGESPQHIRHTTFEWSGGVIALRNSRVLEHHWSTAQESVVQQFHELARERPVVYLLMHWDVEESALDAWAVPEDVAFEAFAKLPMHMGGNSKTVEVGADDHQLKHAPSAPSFAPYYVRAALTDAEQAKLQEAIKTDDTIKQERMASTEEEPNSNTDESTGVEDASVAEGTDDEPTPTFSDETVAFLLELTEHTEDGPWHERNRRRYEHVLRDPSQAIVEGLRTRYIQRLNPAVAGGKRHLSILKKNDYGKGGYHDHYWFAFYDPAAGSKTRSVQLFVRFLGGARVWRYGLAMGNYCGQYLKQLVAAIAGNRKAVADYIRYCPAETVVRLSIGDREEQLSPADFAERLVRLGDDTFVPDGPLTDISIVREYQLGTLPEHAATIVEEIGEYFTWAWPFFEAAMTGAWSAPGPKSLAPKPGDEETGEVDETAPKTIAELAEITALPEPLLSDIEEALWAKRQVILVGPPGTSKTFIARQFARYFVRQRQGQPQGNSDVLFMHASWRYEDFFQGLKPSEGGSLRFEMRTGFFLKWVAKLKDWSPKARHVLVLDEINRCDTAAVLGELLQLLEYRDSPIPLLSGQRFIFPSNVFIIGTMNSADRSIGRMDLALQRRFLQLNLHPQPETLDRWLKRPGNNPLGFQASALARCNELLAEHGILPEQHIGHALFMLQRTAEDDEVSPKLDKPLSEKQLRQIVKFSVLPYVRELLTMQFGQADANLQQQISDLLLQCVEHRNAAAPSESTDDQPAA